MSETPDPPTFDPQEERWKKGLSPSSFTDRFLDTGNGQPGERDVQAALRDGLKQMYAGVWDVDGARHLHGATPWMDREAALRTVGYMPPDYNGFRSGCLAAVLAKLPHNAMVSLGRASSPLVYVWTRDPAWVVERFEACPAPPQELGAIGDSFPGRTVGERPEGNGMWTVVRAWWD